MNDVKRTARATLELDLYPASEAASPAGALLTLGERRAFTGWLQLASVIEDWRQAHEHEQHPSDRRR